MVVSPVGLGDGALELPAFENNKVVIVRFG